MFVVLSKLDTKNLKSINLFDIRETYFWHLHWRFLMFDLVERFFTSRLEIIFDQTSPVGFFTRRISSKKGNLHRNVKDLFLHVRKTNWFEIWSIFSSTLIELQYFRIFHRGTVLKRMIMNRGLKPLLSAWKASVITTCTRLDYWEGWNHD